MSPLNSAVLSSDPCYSYTVLDEPWRATDNRYTFNLKCDLDVYWDGWYRLFIHGQSVQMPDTCVDRLSCGTHAPLWLNGPHPQIEDGVVTRDVCGNWWNDCCGFQSNPIRVKACPGNYYVYEFVQPNFCYVTYCAEVRNISLNIPTLTPEAFLTDPCYNYTALDDPWRAVNNHNSYNCDAAVNWDGWYRLFIEGQNAQMPETCVDQFSCGTIAPLWLNGQHPQIEDGVVTRHVCGHWDNNCCYVVFNPMKVKACPGNYYVYEFISPVSCFMAYCAELMNIGYTDVTPQTTPIVTTPSSDPCSDYNILDDNWRDVRQIISYDHDDILVEWNGWYRLYLNGESAQMSEWCVTYTGCGGEVGLYLGGSHPRLEDGVVTREVLGSTSQWWNPSQCGYYRSTSIDVKACPGDYYVYKLAKPDASILRVAYCAVAFSSISSDPCYNYESLDRPWRATDETGFYICDEYFSWNGWYRLFYNGASIRMPESCVNTGSCNTEFSLTLNGPHPQIEDGVVTMEVCAGSWYSSQNLKAIPIRVKACPGDYYVYELVNQPAYWCSGYCTDVNTMSLVSTTSPATSPEFSTTLNYDPCYNYNFLDNYWRSTFWSMSGYDDPRVEWDGWYRFLINGSSAQMPEWCFSYMSCGGFTSLWLGGSHPQLEDGVVTREVYGSVNDQCSSYTSNPVQVKACPGNFYVYRLVRPNPSIPVPVYCAVLFDTPSTDPCYDYTSLDDSWRATDNYYNNYMCDYNVNWNGWYRLFYYGQSVQMPESSVGYGMCGSYYPLWLNGPHPQLEDGVVTRQICGSPWNDDCGYKSHPIQVKACPGNYYVYEFVKPTFCGSYCADVTKLASTTTSETTVTIEHTESSTVSITTTEAITYDPCYNYTVLDDSWRSTSNQHSSSIMCDAYVSWNGWYRLFIGGQSGQLPDTCVDQYSCSTHAPLWLNGQHPKVEDGVVTRNICGHWYNDCCYFQSNPIKVKACPGNYYVYEFVQPNFCYGTYCAVLTPSSDPCSGYNVLDDDWRDLRTNFYQSYYHDDRYVEWNGWYRLYLNGESAQLSEWCVSFTGCGGDVGLFLNGSHPKPEDGVVTREVLGSTSWAWWWWWWNARHCGSYKSTPIEIKACPGDYYVYKLVKPDMSVSTPAYCAGTVLTCVVLYKLLY